MIPRGSEKLRDPADDLDAVPVARPGPRWVQACRTGTTRGSRAGHRGQPRV